MGQVMMASPDDWALVTLLRQGDRAAAATLVQHHNRTLWRIARGIVGNEADADDVVQEAYLRALSSVAGFRGESSLSTWLARIVVNEAVRRTRSRRPTLDLATVAETAIAGHSAAPAPMPSSPEQAAAREQVRRMVEQAVDGLAAPFRAVFVMRAVEQMSVEETAAALRVPAATVKTRFHRARQQLQQALGAEFAAIFEGAFPFGGARCERLTTAVLARLDRTGTGDLPAPSEPPAPDRTLQGVTAMLRKFLTAAAFACLAAAPSMAAEPDHAPPPAPYQKVSALVKLPDFLPGLGQLYVDPKTLPAGPFLAYDHNGRLVSTVYMIPLKEMNDHKKLDGLASPGGNVDHVDMYYNAGHPGVAVPHYHIVLWHVSRADEASVAK